jgi:hypothetical protein
MLDSAPTEPRIHEAAVCLAVRCRRIVQVCLREEEWIEADRQFYTIIRDGLEALLKHRSDDSAA